jgi:ABC-type transport system involved in cytochrome bd biosynthesis fused ATPase/permease subunit
MIVGPVGCGKSSLLQGLLGEIPSSKGIVYVERSRIAFVGQIPWIQNSSIRNNIIGISSFEPEWYAAVVHACAFDTDIEAFSEGDNTKVGSAGIALSGGQRLRIVSWLMVGTSVRILTFDRHLLELFITDTPY